MSLLPTPVKTHQWDHPVVAAQGNLLNDMKAGLLQIVNTLLAKAVGAPTVTGSSNSVAAGIDGVNRWASGANLVWATAGNAHSWIVLRFGTAFYLCLDLANATSSSMAVFMSGTAFTGGSTTARPTSADEFQVLGTTSAGASWESGTSNIQRAYHIDLSTDSTILRVIVYQNNLQSSFWDIGVPANPVTGWTNPLYGAIAPGQSGTLAGVCTYNNLFSTNVGLYKGKGVSQMSMDLTTEKRGSSGAIGETQTVPNSLSGGYSLTLVGLYSATVGNIGRHGSLNDLWCGSTTNNVGDTYPTGVTREFMTFGCLVMKWDGTILTTA